MLADRRANPDTNLLLVLFSFNAKGNGKELNLTDHFLKLLVHHTIAADVN